jgi:hypothetical protein
MKEFEVLEICKNHEIHHKNGICMDAGNYLLTSPAIALLFLENLSNWPPIIAGS